MLHVERRAPTTFLLQFPHPSLELRASDAGISIYLRTKAITLLQAPPPTGMERGGHHYERKAFIFIETSEAITILELAS